MVVKNFSPELLKIYEIASQREFVFDCKSHKKALALRWRLHSLRRDMRKEKHWLTNIAEGVVISVRDTLLIARPPDFDIKSELQDALKEQSAGLNIESDKLAEQDKARALAPFKLPPKNENSAITEFVKKKGT